MRKRVPLAAAVLALMLGCSEESTVKLSGSSQVPAAQGVVRVTRGENNNTRLRIDVEHLARPEQISSAARALVVWARPTVTGDSQNIGVLHVDANLKGRIETLTPNQDFELMITAETSPTATSPSGAALLSARIRHP